MNIGFYAEEHSKSDQVQEIIKLNLPGRKKKRVRKRERDFIIFTI